MQICNFVYLRESSDHVPAARRSDPTLGEMRSRPGLSVLPLGSHSRTLVLPPPAAVPIELTNTDRSARPAMRKIERPLSLRPALPVAPAGRRGQFDPTSQPELV